MLSSLGILMVATVILTIEVPPLLEKKLKKELILFLIILAIGIGTWILRGFGVTIQSPVDILFPILKPVIDLLSL
ncbi:hypothetical protein MHH81_09895 [Psychrobacillus sp. FSL H8-0484]|uniref:hypothetical protein n=1 Tax=Psychrobacillus sp. FSL H8-0484 TaxID=2921390 RepID=UPI0030F727D6